MSNGDNPIIFEVPSWTIDGNTNAHFWLSTAGDVGKAGLAADGKVDVLSASRRDHEIAWYQKDGNQCFSEYFVSASADESQFVFDEFVAG